MNAASDYRERGWIPIPISARGKDPIRRRWQNSTIETPLHDFIEGCNVGILLGEASGGLVDIDLDCAEAIAAAPHILPSTGLKFGRLAKRNDGASSGDVARMRGERFVTAVESEAKKKMDAALVKQLTGGDTITARALYQHHIEFQPELKLWLATNHKPKIPSTEEAMWRRVHLVPFNVSFRGRENKELEEQLKHESPGILAVMIRSCLEWQRLGLAPPASVTNATNDLFRELDVIGRFMEERLQRDPDAFTFTGDIVRAYRNFVISDDEQTHIDERKLMTEIKERGCYESGTKRNEAGLQRRGLWRVRLKDPQ